MNKGRLRGLDPLERGGVRVAVLKGLEPLLAGHPILRPGVLGPVDPAVAADLGDPHAAAMPPDARVLVVAAEDRVWGPPVVLANLAPALGLMLVLDPLERGGVRVAVREGREPLLAGVRILRPGVLTPPPCPQTPGFSLWPPRTGLGTPQSGRSRSGSRPR